MGSSPLNTNCTSSISADNIVWWMMNTTVTNLRTQYGSAYQNMNEQLKNDTDYFYSCKVPFIYSPSVLDSLFGTKGFVIFALFSMTLTMIVSITIMKNSRLRNIHPSTLIGLIATCEFTIAYNLLIAYIGSNRFVCYFGLSSLWENSINYPIMAFNGIVNSFSSNEMKAFDLVTEKDALKRLEWANTTCFEFFQMLVMFLNICLCFDIFKVFKDPFFPTRLRTKWYIIFSLSVSFMLYPFSRSILQSSDDFYKVFIQAIVSCQELKIDSSTAKMNVDSEYNKTFMNTLIIIVYMLVATYSIGFIKNMQRGKDRSVS